MGLGEDQSRMKSAHCISCLALGPDRGHAAVDCVSSCALVTAFARAGHLLSRLLLESREKSLDHPRVWGEGLFYFSMLPSSCFSLPKLVFTHASGELEEDRKRARDCSSLLCPPRSSRGTHHPPQSSICRRLPILLGHSSLLRGSHPAEGCAREVACMNS